MRDRFSAPELRQWIRSLPDGEDILTFEPEGQAVGVLADEAVDALYRRGALDRAFFEALQRSRSRLYHEIAPIAAAFDARLQEDPSDIALQASLDGPRRRFLRPAYALPEWKVRGEAWRTEGDPRGWIADFFADNAATVSGQCRVLTLAGALGAGRSRLAFAYADENRGRYQSVRWLHAAGGVEEVRKQLADHARVWKIHRQEAEIPEEDLIVELRARMASSRRRHLLVFDDPFQGPEEHDAMAAEIAAFTGPVDVLVVSADDGWGGGGEACLELGALQPSAAIDLILHGTRRSAEWSAFEIGAARQIAGYLGYFPMALALASLLVGKLRPSRVLALLRAEDVPAGEKRRSDWIAGPVDPDAVAAGRLLPAPGAHSGVGMDAVGSALKAVSGLRAAADRRASSLWVTLSALSWAAPEQPLGVSPLTQMARSVGALSGVSIAEDEIEGEVLDRLASSGVVWLGEDRAAAIHALIQAVVRRETAAQQDGQAALARQEGAVLDVLADLAPETLPDDQFRVERAGESTSEGFNPVFWHQVAVVGRLASSSGPLQPRHRELAWRVVRLLKNEGLFDRGARLATDLLAMSASRLDPITRVRLLIERGQCQQNLNEAPWKRAMEDYDAAAALAAKHVATVPGDRASALPLQVAARRYAIWLELDDAHPPTKARIKALLRELQEAQRLLRSCEADASTWRTDFLLPMTEGKALSALAVADPARLDTVTLVKALAQYKEAEKRFLQHVPDDQRRAEDVEYASLLYLGARARCDAPVGSPLFSEGVQQLREAVASFERLQAKGHRDLWAARLTLAKYLTDLDQWDEALAQAGRAYEVALRRTPPRDTEIADATYRLGNIRLAQALSALERSRSRLMLVGQEPDASAASAQGESRASLLQVAKRHLEEAGQKYHPQWQEAVARWDAAMASTLLSWVETGRAVSGAPDELERGLEDLRDHSSLYQPRKSMLERVKSLFARSSASP